MTKRKAKRKYEQNPVVYDQGTPCKHCGHRYDHIYREGGRCRNTPGGPRWYMTCGGCGRNFVKKRLPGEE